MPTDIFLFLPPCEGDDYSEAHPYGPSDHHFNDNLGIDIASTLKDRYPALAVVSGMARLIPDPLVPGSADPPTGTLVLLPSPTEFRNLRSVVGGSPVVFIYHNLEIEHISTDLDLRIRTYRGEFVEAAEEEEYSTVDELIEEFLSGRIAVSVSGGNGLALAGIRADNRDCCRLGFQIAFIPSGLRLGEDESWNLLQPLITNPNTRRLDPLSFYADVLRSSSSDIRIAAAHADHPLFTLTTRRILVELRDEYDMPFQGVATYHTFTEGNRGTVVCETVSPGDEPLDEAILNSVEYENYVFTDLPSGSSASARPSKNLTPPAHWAMQMIFMADVEDTANWFGCNTILQGYTENNRVTYLIDGLVAFRAMVEAIRTVNRRDHYLWLAHWFVDDDFNLIPGDHSSRFRNLLQAMPHTDRDGGVQVRALLWNSVCAKTSLLEWELGTQNNAEVEHINELSGDCHAILDNTTRSLGSHHQKMMIINGSTGRPVAFCGGVDINPDRLDDSRHLALSPYHDVHAKVEGPAVDDLSWTFVNRWNRHPERPSGESLSPVLSTSPAGSHYVQVTRTFPSGVANAPPAEHSTLNAIIRAIEHSRKFIYFEDQYAVPYAGSYPFVPSQDDLGIVTALRNALDQIEYLIIVIPNHSDLAQHRYRRNNFIKSLRDVARDKVFVFYLERSGGPRGIPADSPACQPYLRGPAPRTDSGSASWPNEIYVHSKVWIVDDIYVKIGSANCNRRSLTYDSEVDIHIIDGALWNGGRQFARDFRIALWAEHLNMARTGAQRAKLEDPIFALRFWQAPPDGARIRQYREDEDIEYVHTDVMWNNSWDPDGR